METEADPYPSFVAHHSSHSSSHHSCTDFGDGVVVFSLDQNEHPDATQRESCQFDVEFAANVLGQLLEELCFAGMVMVLIRVWGVL
jgi:hypothetical protein